MIRSLLPATSSCSLITASVLVAFVGCNTILDNQPTGPSLASGGIVLASTRATGGADPQHNTVRHNHLRRNQPADLSSDGTGVDNTITGNRCATSIPSDLGGCGSYGNSHN